jgi:signal transduction histidine kinase
MNRFVRFMKSLPGPAVSALGLVLVGLLGVADFATGHEISFAVFYLLPVCLVTWFAGRGRGILVSFASAVVWLIADSLVVHPPYSHPLIPFWNALVRLGFFLVTTFVLSALRNNLERRRALERIFFHDILNVTGSIRGFTELLQDQAVADKEALYTLIRRAVEQSIDEIESQRIMTAAEHLELPVASEPLGARALVERVVDQYRPQDFAQGRHIAIEGGEEIHFTSDSTLLMRILGNLLKNALEASTEGETVRVGFGPVKGGVEFHVWNRSVIPEDLRGGIFHRVPSRKEGRERGFGTYSVRLLSECLGGEVSYASEKSQGTTFRVRLPLGGVKNEVA